jgi:predicted RNase H-like nuclease
MLNNAIENFSQENDISILPKKELKNLEDRVDAFLCAYAVWLSTNAGNY